MKCDRVNCTNEALYYPVLYLYPQIFGLFAPPAQCSLNLNVCEQHKRKSTVADYIDDTLWAQILTGFQRTGKHPPDRNLTKVTYEPLANIPEVG